MFPKMMNSKVAQVIDEYRSKALAWKLSGAGGGGYLILISEKPIPNAIRINIRIKDYWI
jgi:mevalonate kinase